MKHWSVDTTKLEKDAKAFAVWQLEQAINFGLRDSKIKKSDLRAHWEKLDLDPAKKKFLALALAE